MPYPKATHEGNRIHPNIVLFSDSKSALKALENYGINSHMAIGTLAESIDGLLTSYNIQITLQWVPGHSDVRGNEHADHLAKQGAEKKQPDNACSYDTARQKLVRYSRTISRACFYLSTCWHKKCVTIQVGQCRV